MSKKDVGYLIKSINDKMKIQADADLKHHRLTFTQSRILAFLNDNGGQSTQKEIERFLSVAHPTVVGLISRMEQSGYVTCHLCPDNRNKNVMLTEKAKAISMEMKQHILSHEKALLANLSSEEVKHLKEMLLTLYKTLDA